MLMLRGCEIMWDVDRADQAQRLIEESTGRPCPCVTGERCPLLPADVQLPPPVPPVPPAAAA